MKNRLGRNFIESGLLCLKVSAPLIETGDDNEDDSRSKHQPGEEGKVLIVADLMSGACAQNPFIDEADEEFTRSDSEKPQRHHRTLHRIRCLGIGKFQTSDRHHRFTERENNVGQELPIDVRSYPCIDPPLDHDNNDKRESGDEKPDSDFSQRSERESGVDQREIADNSRPVCSIRCPQVDDPRVSLAGGQMQTYLVISTAGPNRDLSKDTRDQPYWDDHAAFIDGLVDDGFIFLGGPLVDEGGAVIAVHAQDEAEVRAILANDPWYQNGILTLASIKRWQIFIDKRPELSVSP